MTGKILKSYTTPLKLVIDNDVISIFAQSSFSTSEIEIHKFVKVQAKIRPVYFCVITGGINKNMKIRMHEPTKHKAEASCLSNSIKSY